MIKIEIPLWLSKAKEFENKATGGYICKFHTGEISKETDKAYFFDEIHSYGLKRKVFTGVILPKSQTKIEVKDDDVIIEYNYVYDAESAFSEGLRGGQG